MGAGRLCFLTPAGAQNAASGAFPGLRDGVWRKTLTGSPESLSPKFSPALATHLLGDFEPMAPSLSLHFSTAIWFFKAFRQQLGHPEAPLSEFTDHRHLS